jgi:hypothetical protein
MHSCIMYVYKCIVLIPYSTIVPWVIVLLSGPLGFMGRGDVLHAPAPVAGDEEDDPWNTETHAHKHELEEH